MIRKIVAPSTTIVMELTVRQQRLIPGETAASSRLYFDKFVKSMYT